MTFLYNTGIFFYGVSVRIASLLNEKAKLFVKGRRNWKKNLQSQIEKESRYIWFHSASLGEFEQGRPVIEELKKQYPEYRIVLTFFSPSGYEVRKNYNGADIICYLPLDTKTNAHTFLEIVKPEKAFFIKYEFWYNYISELKNRNIPLYIFSAIFRDSQPFFKNNPWGRWYKKMLFAFEHLFVQNQASGELLDTIDISNYSISGDTRFDRVIQITGSSKELPFVEKFKGKSPLIIAGSTWRPDEELLAEVINNSDGVKYIIAPHEVSNSNVNRIQQLLKKSVCRYSKLDKTQINRYEVLIIDSIGLLSSLYRYGDIAYIGGGFGVGIHNILEAATFGMPVIFGPKFEKFKEAVDLVSVGGAFAINNLNGLDTLIRNFLNDQIRLENTSKISKNYVEKNGGATKVIIKKVFNTNNILD